MRLTEEELHILNVVSCSEGLSSYYYFVQDVLVKLQGSEQVNAEFNAVEPLTRYVNMINEDETFDESSLLLLIFNLPVFHYCVYSVSNDAIEKWEPTQMSFHDWYAGVCDGDLKTRPVTDTRNLGTVLFNWMMSLCSNDVTAKNKRKSQTMYFHPQNQLKH